MRMLNEIVFDLAFLLPLVVGLLALFSLPLLRVGAQRERIAWFGVVVTVGWAVQMVAFGLVSMMMALFHVRSVRPMAAIGGALVAGCGLLVTIFSTRLLGLVVRRLKGWDDEQTWRMPSRVLGGYGVYLLLLGAALVCHSLRL